MNRAEQPKPVFSTIIIIVTAPAAKIFNRKNQSPRRALVILLLAALLVPLALFGQPRPVAARSAPGSDSSPIAGNALSPMTTTLPEAFAAPGIEETGASEWAAGFALPYLLSAGNSLADNYRATANVIAPPELPAGFSQARLPTLRERVAAIWSDSTADADAAPVAHTVEPSAPPPPAAPATARFDFDLDGKADVTRFQPATNIWTIKRSSNGSLLTTTLGTSGSVVTSADYDGDGITDLAVWNQYSADWTILQSSNGQTFALNAFGLNGDKIVSADYDGDGKADLALFRPSNGTWYVRRSSSGQFTSVQFGQAGDIPVVGNYDGDGLADYAVFRPSSGTWYVQPGSGAAGFQFQWGLGSDIPVPADYTGDGKTDYAVYRPSTGTWYVQPNGSGNAFAKTWGNYGDQPAAADYDGDGKADLAVWRPTNGIWYIVKSSVAGMTTYQYDQLGILGDVAVPSAYYKQIGSSALTYDLANARLHPQNATDGSTDLYSRNVGWSGGLVNLPGRAGLDAGFGISYNSLVWTKEPISNTIVFDADHSNITPGFRFGFPVIEPNYYNALTQQYSYLMVTPSGSRVEFRQTAASGVYETADSSYAQLTVIAGGIGQGVEGATLVVKTTSGTQMTYLWRAGSYRLAEIKDRNGNFISVVYDQQYGLLQSMTDTLGRVVTVEYDADFCPTAVKQNWQSNNGAGGTVVHTYATFSYGYQAINPSFAAGINVYGPSNGAYVKVLQALTYADGTAITFNYNDYGQIYKIRNLAADGHELNSTRTDLQTPAANQTDCPRLATTYQKIENFNNNQETVIHNTWTANQTFAAGGEYLGPSDVTEAWLDGDPHSVHTKTYYYTAGNWMEGLPFGTEDVADGGRQRWRRTVWTQDDLNKIYKVNPRVVESKVGDQTNIKRVTMNYYLQSGSTTVSQFGLVKETRVYDADQTTVLKKTVAKYQTAAAYLDRRVIGLPIEQQLYDGETNLVSKMLYAYDAGNFGDANLQQNLSSVIQHDNTNYGASFIIGRGNATSMTRCDVTVSSDINCGGGISSQMKYNTAGATVARITPGSTAGATRQITIGYADAFNDSNNNRNTYAYPTKLIDPAQYYSLVNYRFDVGANVWAQSPAPIGNSNGKVSKRIFDAVGRLERQSIFKDGGTIEYAYARYDYSPADRDTHSRVYSTLTDTNNNNRGDQADEVLTESWADGAGRVYQSRTPLTFGAGGATATWTGQKAVYDLLGQVASQTVPTEIDANWNPTGADQVWRTTAQEYDWKGRVTRELGLDNIDRLYSYDGCGCAGGQVTTVQGELVDGKRRTQRAYADILGRTWKTEVLDYDTQTYPDRIYTSTITKFNGRDQELWTKQFAGAAPSDALYNDSCPVPQANEAQSCQIATAEYDGHGRTSKSHAPQQDAGKFTTYTYNAADQPETVTDAWGAVSTYSYNNRGLVETIQQQAPPLGTASPAFSSCVNSGDPCFADGGNNASNAPPIGNLDYADSTVREVGGWSFDPDNRYDSSYVNIYIDGYANNGGTLIATVYADQSRPDVGQHYPGAGNNHGYKFVIPEQYADGKSHLIYAYGLDTGNSQPRLLNDAPRAMILDSLVKTTAFEYDALGNRTKMTDATGVTNYEYDPLSRVTAEKKHLADNWSIANHDFNISYAYNLGGQLKSVTDPFNDTINYGMDKGGKLKGITGTPFSSTDGYGTTTVTNYVDDIGYRAWGAVKSMDYGNTVKMTQDFDSRLQVSQFNVQKTGQATSLIKKSYQYYDDNRLKFSDDTGDATIRSDSHRFDRSYSYDLMGRLTAARTGSEARNDPSNTDRNTLPYKHDYIYNAFGNVTSRQTFTWTEPDNQTNSWVNGRETTWGYDEDGRLKYTPENHYDYDPGGVIKAVMLKGKSASFMMTDGEGRSVRRDSYQGNQVNSSQAFKRTEYAIYSSVLGKMLTEVKSDGTKKRTYVYGTGGVVATQNKSGAGNAAQQSVTWQHRDPSNASFITTGTAGDPYYFDDGDGGGQVELDPLGSNVGVSNPYAGGSSNLAPLGGGWGGWGDPFGGYSCRLDGFETPCSQVMYALSAGFAEFNQNFNQPSGVGHWIDEPDYGHMNDGFPGVKTHFVPFFNLFDRASQTIQAPINANEGEGRIGDYQGKEGEKDKPKCTISVTDYGNMKDGYEGKIPGGFTDLGVANGEETGDTHRVEIRGKVTGTSNFLVRQMVGRLFIDRSGEVSVNRGDDDPLPIFSQSNTTTGEFSFLDAPGIGPGSSGIYRANFTSYIEANQKVICSVDWHVEINTLPGQRYNNFGLGWIH